MAPSPDSLRQALESALVENPDDLATHRAYADLLMEQGDLVFAKFGRSRRIPWSGLHAFAQSRLSGGAA